ncbi:MAG TPA: porin [Gammaproteobacteria bacterium]|nr:porin [Gammaproteobacteria bacterium]
MPFKTALRFGPAALTILLVSNSEAAVEIYGRANLALEILDNGDDSGLNVSSNASRIGFKGETQIIEGLKGVFQLEQEIRFDNGSGTFATRDTYAGLQGNFGSVRLGYFDTPLKKIRSETDFFNDQLGDARNLTRLNNITIVPATAPAVPLYADFDTRFYNGIIYTTPDLGGFTVDLHHSTNNNGATANPPDDLTDATSAGVTYKAGSLYVSLAHEVDSGRNDSAATRLGARYTLGDLTLAGLAQQATVNPIPANLPGPPPVATSGDAIDIRTLGFGASYKLTENTVLKGQVYNNADARDNRDARLWAVGMDYSLSKQFRLQFVYAATNNDGLANYRASGGGNGDQISPVVGKDVAGIAAGIRYDFN